jgi:hypothetical protein
VTIRRPQIALLACAAALAVGGCGSDDTEGPGVPAASVQAIDSQLDELMRRVDVRITGACRDAQEQNIPDLESQVLRLPDDTDPEIRQALSESIDRLKSLLDDECTDVAKQEERERQNTETTETVPPETNTQTETTPQTNTQTAPTTTPEQNGNNGNGNNGNGNGNGNDEQGGSTPPGGDGSGGVLSPE